MRTSQELNDISADILAHMPMFLGFFGVDMREDAAGYHGCCPIHQNSDNPTACSIYKNTGMWQCRTHHCEQYFKKTSLGFIRGLLSRQKLNWDSNCCTENMFDFNQTINICQQLIAKNPTTQFLSTNKHIYVPKVREPEKLLDLSIDTYLDSVICPSPYFIERGFKPEILDRFCVGDYHAKYKQMSGRSVVPIFNDSGTKIVAASGRLPHPKCLICSGYHKTGDLCPDNNFAKQKWIHTKGFQRNNHLYNWCFAQHYIAKKREIILVEGPADVWKATEARLFNVCAILGSNMSPQQIEKINSLAIKSVITMFDNDEGGDKARQSCEAGFTNVRIRHAIPSANDLGDMEPHQISEIYYAAKS